MRAFSLSVALLIGAALPAHADFASCVAGLRSAAVSAGVSGSTFDRVMRGVEPDMKVIELMQNQPEFRTPIWDYLATLVDDQKVSEGRALLQKHASLLARIEQAYGVDRHAVVAVWGVESDYGQIASGRFLPQSLSTVACLGPRRRDFFRGELISTLKIIERGDLAAEKLRGSWAGAFGHTQFIPSTYLRLAVDFDGDGKRDLVDSIPDALASTANYLKRSGWITGASWGYEVKLPSGYSGPSGRTNKSGMDAWASRGITRLDGGAVSGLPAAGLLLPAGRNGPAFLVTKTSTPPMPTTPPRATRWRFPSFPIVCAAAPACARPGRRMIAASPAPSARPCRNGSWRAAMMSASRMARSVRSPAPLSRMWRRSSDLRKQAAPAARCLMRCDNQNRIYPQPSF